MASVAVDVHHDRAAVDSVVPVQVALEGSVAGLLVITATFPVAAL